MADEPDALHAELRHLRAKLHEVEEERDDLRARLAYAEQQIQELRAKVIGQVNQAAQPGNR